MGAMGSDMAVETADVVIQTDEPGKVAEAVAIGKRTRRIVYQNIILAIGVKLIVMILEVWRGKSMGSCICRQWSSIACCYEQYTCILNEKSGI